MGQPEAEHVYCFPIEDQGRVSPYGVYYLAENAGWRNVDIDHDTITSVH